MTMLSLASVRARFHPGSYLWLAPTIVILGYRIKTISPDFESIISGISLILYVHFTNFLIWVHNKNEKKVAAYIFVGSIIAVFSTGYSTLMAGAMCLVILLGYVYKSELMQIIILLSVLALSWSFEHYWNVSLLPFTAAYFIFELNRFRVKRTSRRERNTSLSIYFLHCGLLLVASAAISGDVEILQASLLLFITYKAIK